MDVITALRTAPHTDVEATRVRAIERLLRIIRDGLRPASVLIKPPVLLPGEYAVTEVEPARSLYRMLHEIQAMPGILDVSFFPGFAWVDSEFASTSVLVVAEEDEAQARREAVRLAQAVWDAREQFGPDTETASVDESITRALATPDGPVFIADSGDNVTAGGAGDNPIFVERLLAAGAGDAVVAGIQDADAVAACARAGLDAEVSLIIGGRIDRVYGWPLDVTGRVVRLSPSDDPKFAVLRVGGVDVILTAEWHPFWGDAMFKPAGIDPHDYHIVVGKFGYLFDDFRKYAARSIMALSQGFATQRVAELPFTKIRRPIFPIDRDFEWSPADADC